MDFEGKHLFTRLCSEHSLINSTYPQLFQENKTTYLGQFTRVIKTMVKEDKLFFFGYTIAFMSFYFMLIR